MFDIRCLCYYYIYTLLLLYIILLYIIIYYTIILFHSPPPSHLSSSHSFPSFPIFILYLSVLTYTYLYYSSLLLSFLPKPQQFLPRTNYRRDVSSGVVLFVWCFKFELVRRYWCFGVIVRYSAVFLPNPSRIGVSE